MILTLIISGKAFSQRVGNNENQPSEGEWAVLYGGEQSQGPGEKAKGEGVGAGRCYLYEGCKVHPHVHVY